MNLYVDLALHFVYIIGQSSTGNYYKAEYYCGVDDMCKSMTARFSPVTSNHCSITGGGRGVN